MALATICNTLALRQWILHRQTSLFRKSKNVDRTALEKKSEKADSFLQEVALLFLNFFILSSSGYWGVFHNYGAIYFSGDLDTEVISGV